MGTIRDQEKIEETRARLYARGKMDTRSERPTLTRSDIKAEETWHDAAPVSAATPDDTPAFTPTMPKRKKNYRLVLLAIGAAVFVLSIIASSIFFFVGNNNISGDNIALQINGPIAVAGGDTLTMQVGVTNQNPTPIISATLIMEYPAGFRSAEEGNDSNLFRERIPLEVIDSGEAVNIPVRAVVFGEENERKIVNAAVEYRISGSNQVFFKEATPFEVQVSSAPLVIDIDGLDIISSGQETDFTITLRSNAPNVLRNVLVTAQYPTGFRYVEASPAADSGNNLWRFAEIEPEEEVEIVLTGVISGEVTDGLSLQFDAGTAESEQALRIDSVLTTASSDLVVEAPFIDVAVTIDDQRGVIIVPNEDNLNFSPEITISNQLRSSVYNLRVVAKPVGNVLTDEGIRSRTGFYNSVTKEITWDQSAVSGFSELNPGQDISVSFDVFPEINVSEPEATFSVDVFAKRIQAERAAEELIGSAELTVKVSGQPRFLADVGRNVEGFVDVGTVPPIAEQETSYTIGWQVFGGLNGFENSIVTATLPTYVLWRDEYSGNGSVSFNPVSREVQWRMGEVNAAGSEILSFQVSIIPSIAQIDQTPDLILQPRFEATDKFTGSRVTATTKTLTTELPSEAGFRRGNGEVVPASTGNFD